MCLIDKNMCFNNKSTCLQSLDMSMQQMDTYIRIPLVHESLFYGTRDVI
jgi:hypothetical protein